MWRTTDGRARATASRTVAGSRMSPMIAASRRPEPILLHRLGSVSGASDRPVTRAPSRASQTAAQAPLKPVWPVSRTRRSRQKPMSGLIALPGLPGRGAAGPQRFELLLVAQCVHWLPEAIVDEGRQLSVGGKAAERVELPRHVVALDAIEHARIEHEEAAVDAAAVAGRFF